ncbi:hypothetical protein J3F83DRAFT_748013 [Trichoderma novae-zelandiae]
MDAATGRFTASLSQVRSQKRLIRLNNTQNCHRRLFVAHSPSLSHSHSHLRLHTQSRYRSSLSSPSTHRLSPSHPRPSSPSRTTTKPFTTAMNVPQPVQAPLTKSATFLVLTINPSPSSPSPSALQTIRSTLASVDDLSKNVSIRDLNSSFSVTVGIGSAAWDVLVPPSSGLPKPAELHPFRPVDGDRHSAPATPGDLLFHIRSDRRDICFEFESQLLQRLGDSVEVQDDTQGFRYFDARDLLGFVDGTANPAASALPEALLITEQDDAKACVGGTYVVVQKYVHDIPSWRSLSTSTQEAIIGRTKADNMELDDQPPGSQQPHKTLTTIEDEHGNEHGIMRDNMPFGSPGSGVFGTYFIGYSRRLWVVEKMLERMFVGDPPGKHDRILDFSRALTGSTFYVPPGWVLGKLAED